MATPRIRAVMSIQAGGMYWILGKWIKVSLWNKCLFYLLTVYTKTDINFVSALIIRTEYFCLDLIVNALRSFFSRSIRFSSWSIPMHSTMHFSFSEDDEWGWGWWVMCYQRKSKAECPGQMSAVSLDQFPASGADPQVRTWVETHDITIYKDTAATVSLLRIHAAQCPLVILLFYDAGVRLFLTQESGVKAWASACYSSLHCQPSRAVINHREANMSRCHGEPQISITSIRISEGLDGWPSKR